MKRQLFVSVIILFSFFSVIAYSQDSNTFIILKTGEKLFGKVEYKTPLFATSYIIFDDSTEYQLSKIKSFQDNTGFYSSVPESMKFVKLIKEGKINLYRETVTFSSPGMFSTMSTPGGTISTFHPGTSSSLDFDYFSKDSNGLMDASYSNLLQALADNNTSVEHLKTYRTLSFVTYGLVGGGIVTMIVGLATSDKDKANIGMLVAGGVIAVSAWIPYLIAQSEYDEAIMSYNH